MKHNIIFIGGVHGVGKTTLSNNICNLLGISHYSASDLIKKVNNIELPSNKRVKEMRVNQDLFILAVDKYVKREAISIIDGHFCLLSIDGEIVEVPISTFRSISPIAIIVLIDKPSEIHSRISTRDGMNTDIGNIALFQDKEIKYSKSLSQIFDIPYLLANPITDIKVVEDFIRKLIK